MPLGSAFPARAFHGRRSSAVLDLRRPGLAVWRGEVVVVATPEPRALGALLHGPPHRASGRLRVAESVVAYDAGHGELRPAATLAERAAGGAAVLAGVVLRPTPAGRRALAALRLTVARRAPCRCLWLVGGRVYPE